MEPQSPPPPASPFNPVPRPIPPSGGGCSKPLIVGCVAIFLVGAVAVIGGIFYVGTHAAALLQWTLQQTENGLLLQLPKDITPEEKASLQQQYASAQQQEQQELSDDSSIIAQHGSTSACKVVRKVEEQVRAAA